MTKKIERYNTSPKNKVKKIVKKGILISGALARVFIGLGATVLLFCSLKKKKAK